jgi:hypothetical protein
VIPERIYTSGISGQLLRVDNIDLPTEYERKASLVEDDALRQSIEKSGVQQSVIVMLAENGRFTILAMLSSEIREEFDRFAEVYV